MNMLKLRSYPGLGPLIIRPTVWVWTEVICDDIVVCCNWDNVEHAIKYVKRHEGIEDAFAYLLENEKTMLLCMNMSVAGRTPPTSYLMQTVDGVANLPINGSEFHLHLDLDGKIIEQTWLSRLALDNRAGVAKNTSNIQIDHGED